MTPLNEYDQRLIAEAIARAERRTGAELVAVLARRADDYAYLPLFWAALLALLTACVMHALPGWPDGRSLLLMHMLLFIGLCLLLRSPRLTRWVVPLALRHWQAARLARQQFADQHVERTLAATGVLIFVCEAEQYVQILVDQGVELHLSADAREAIVARFTEQLRQGQLLQGFINCIDACGELLSQQLPPSRTRSSLPNRLVLLD